jgi:hypothetical protein
VPDFVEGLGDVNKSSRTVLVSVHGVLDDPNVAMDLFER